jgi:hypothetical protein
VHHTPRCNKFLLLLLLLLLLFVLLLLFLLLLQALQLQRSFGLLNEFLPFDPVSDAVLPVHIFILVISLFTSSSQ